MHERILLHGKLSTIRIAIAAVFHQAIVDYDPFYVVYPATGDPLDLNRPCGAPIDPEKEINQEYALSKTRISDFDLYTIFHDPECGRQFLKWKHLASTGPFPDFSPGSLIAGVTNAFSERFPPISPCLRIGQLASDTANFIQSITRPDLMSPGLDAFLSSNTFELELLQDLAPGRSPSLCTVHKCRIASMDGSPHTYDLPDLCVKLFDDRFHSMDDPDEEELDNDDNALDDRFDLMEDSDVARLIARCIVAENALRREESAYNALEFMQGALIPRYYGSHLVRNFLSATGSLSEDICQVHFIGWPHCLWYPFGIYSRASAFTRKRKALH